MIIETNEMTKEAFEVAAKDNNWEVFTENQIKNYAIHMANLLAKAQRDDLSEQENKNLKIGQAEIESFQSIKVVENVKGHIIKSMVWYSPKQVELTDTLEKSENGETIQKGIFLDTELNRKLDRVGQEFTKGCTSDKIEKKEPAKKKESGLFDKLEKSDETDETEDDSEEIDENPEENDEEVEKHLQDTLNKLNDNFNKGFIQEDLYTRAIGQFEDFIQKSRPTKYFKREGAPGSYKYYYTKEEYNRAKGGQQTEMSHGKEADSKSIAQQNRERDGEHAKGITKQNTGEKPTESKEGEKKSGLIPLTEEQSKRVNLELVSTQKKLDKELSYSKDSQNTSRIDELSLHVNKLKNMIKNGWNAPNFGNHTDTKSTENKELKQGDKVKVSNVGEGIYGHKTEEGLYVKFKDGSDGYFDESQISKKD